jgi:hypothetical protein
LAPRQDHALVGDAQPRRAPTSTARPITW